MSVKICNRGNCQNVMCDEMVTIPGDSQYYICDWCMDELKIVLSHMDDASTKADVRQTMIDFFESNPGSKDSKVCNPMEYLKSTLGET